MTGRSWHGFALLKDACRAALANGFVKFVEDGGNSHAFVRELMFWTEYAGEAGCAPQGNHFGPRTVKVQVTTHGTASAELGFPQLRPGQVDEVHAFAHDEQVLLRAGLVTQGVQDVGDVLGRAKVHLALHAQQFELRTFG